jgi:Uma2 family endonuclease
MNVRLRSTPPGPGPYYPDSDGKPMADNTLQFQWIVTVQGNLDLLFRDRADVFVASDNLIYPVEGDSSICQAPDVYVAFGRPKGHRGSYKVFEEGGVFPQVVFEVLSPSNQLRDMLDKFQFYQQFGVQEYYMIDPETGREALEIWRRDGDRMRAVDPAGGWVSPLLGVRFIMSPTAVELFYPNGQRFLTFVELGVRAEQERQRADSEKQRADALAAKLRELGVDPDRI